MDEKKMKEELKKWRKGEIISANTVSDLFDFLEAYLKVEGFPEKKMCECVLESCNICGKDGYNQALEECKLAHLKEVEILKSAADRCDKAIHSMLKGVNNET